MATPDEQQSTAPEQSADASVAPEAPAWASPEEKLAAAENEIAALKEQLKDQQLRNLAEMENLRKRNAQEIGNARDFAAKDFAFSLLAVKDTLEMVLKGTGRTWQAPSVHGQRSPVSVLGLRAVHLTASFLLLVRSATAAPMPMRLTRCTGWPAIRCPVSRSIPIFRSPSI